MKIQIVSDLHMEFRNHGTKNPWEYYFEKTEADTLVLAGDILNIKEIYAYKDFFDYVSKSYKNVIYVAGNHEYYGLHIDKADEYAYNMLKEYPNVHFFNRGMTKLVLDDKTFYCGTFWSRLEDPLLKLKLMSFPDFRLIQGFSPAFFDYLCIDSEVDLEELLEENSNAVIVTHHAPSYMSCDLKYVGNEYNAFFMNDLDKLIMDKQPKLWIHGHVHNNCSYQIGSTSVVCNPYGYANENPNFNKKLIVEI